MRLISVFCGKTAVGWYNLANEAWAHGEYGDTDTMEQINRIVQGVKDGVIPLPEETKQQLLASFDYDEETGRKPAGSNICLRYTKKTGRPTMA